MTSPTHPTLTLYPAAFSTRLEDGFTVFRVEQQVRWGLNGFIPLVTWPGHDEAADTYTCDSCNKIFMNPLGWNPWTEAEEVFTAAELEDYIRVCDGCWHLMRDDMPDFDERYR